MTQQMDPILQQVLMILIQALTPVVLGAFSALIVVGIKWVRTRVAHEQIDLVLKLVDTAVQAAEQNGLNGTLRNLAQDKKTWAINQVQAELDTRGIKLDVATIEAMIEAAVNAYDFPHVEEQLEAPDPSDQPKLPQPTP